MAQLGLRSELWFLVLSLLGIFEVLFACHFEVEKEPVRKILTSESGDLGFGVSLPSLHFANIFPQAF